MLQEAVLVPNGGHVMHVVTTVVVLHLTSGHLQPVVVVKTVGVQFLSILQSSTVFVTSQGFGQGSDVVVHGCVMVMVPPAMMVVFVTVTVTRGRVIGGRVTGGRVTGGGMMVWKTVTVLVQVLIGGLTVGRVIGSVKRVIGSPMVIGRLVVGKTDTSTWPCTVLGCCQSLGDIKRCDSRKYTCTRAQARQRLR